MRRVIVLAALAVLAGDAHAQSSAPRYAIVTAYDRVRQISSETVSLGEVRPGLNLTLAAWYDGTTPRDQNPLAMLHFSSTSSDWFYLHYSDVACLVDGKKLGRIESQHTGHVGSGSVLEFIHAPLSSQQFTRLARAQSAICTVGTSEFTLSPEALDSFVRLRAKLTGKQVDPFSPDSLRAAREKATLLYLQRKFSKDTTERG